jgi:tRNA pseudouridine32 synthase/23S rRNA pseudouridine746 synthase/23S rRNA pseudouridine1911/1915/1917 synthase
MQEKQKQIKRTTKRHQPKGMTIVYEDRDIIVVNKRCGLLTISNENVRENTAYYLLNDYVRKGNPKSRNRIFIVHRLDKDTSGVIIFAKSEQAKRYLQDEWRNFSKTYYTVVHGIPAKKEDIITSYLTENSAHKMYSVTDPAKGKFAKTGYKVIKESKTHSLLEIYLYTGRKNQIRAHLSEQGHPVVGDRRYGKKEEGSKKLALHAGSLTITHPYSKKSMTFTAETPSYFKTFLKNKNQ